MMVTTRISKWEYETTKQLSNFTNEQLLNEIYKSELYLDKFSESRHYREILKLLNKEKQKRNL